MKALARRADRFREVDYRPCEFAGARAFTGFLSESTNIRRSFVSPCSLTDSLRDAEHLFIFMYGNMSVDDGISQAIAGIYDPIRNG